MKIKEVADLTGITVRTLHYYDEIGLLHPSKITEAGYRLYDETSLENLQQILFFRELGFPLSEIKIIMENPNFNRIETLSKHKEVLIKKKERLDGLIQLVNRTMKGEKTMSFREFDMTEIDRCKKEYANEVEKLWGGSKAYEESQKKTKNYGKEQWQQISGESQGILKAFASNMDKAPDSNEIQRLVKQWQEFITERFYNCTNEILSGLGMMYVEDERFKKSIDKYGKGTAEFIAKAIEIYCFK
ncbi:MerR family transcriptional regulator [Clostridiaceae bacterium M8S5]|nr:MerR family transcriptional regulator [Clostridiaceae bacterium M8S5]